MKAYLVFSGGGVLGSALAGAWRAASLPRAGNSGDLEPAIEPLGFGGTSAGAILACLAAVGYDAETVYRLMLDTEFTELLEGGDDDRKSPIFRALKLSRKLGRIFGDSKRNSCSLRPSFKSIISTPSMCTEAWSLYTLFKDNGGGLDSGEEFNNWLSRGLKESPLFKPSGDSDTAYKKKFEDYQTSEGEKFDRSNPRLRDLQALSQRPLRIVASALTSRSVKIFDSHHPDGLHADTHIIDAVRASMSYPFAFSPVFLDEEIIVDGGLCSNVPVFLFEDLRRQDRVPVMALQLSYPREPKPNGLVRPMISTAIEGSDKIVSGLLRDVHPVDIEIPLKIEDQSIDALAFDIKRPIREKLADVGANAFEKYYEQTLAKRVEKKRQERKRIIDSDPGAKYDPALVKVIGLQLDYGMPKATLEPLLALLAAELEQEFRNKDVRVHVMLPTNEGTRIVVYQHGMGGHSDMHLELGEGVGCSGRAAGYCCNEENESIPPGPVAANLAEVRQDLEMALKEWHMSKNLVNHTRETQLAMFSLPVGTLFNDGKAISPDGTHHDERQHTVLISKATLSVDTSTPMENTGWADFSEPGEPNISENFLTRMMWWSSVVCRLLAPEQFLESVPDAEDDDKSKD